MPTRWPPASSGWCPSRSCARPWATRPAISWAGISARPACRTAGAPRSKQPGISRPAPRASDMATLLGRVRRNIMLKTVSDTLTRGLTFVFSTLILARYLGAKEFGVMSAAYTPAVLVTILADPGIHLLVTRE